MDSMHFPNIIILTLLVATPLLEECEDDTHTPEMGTSEDSWNFKVQL